MFEVFNYSPNSKDMAVRTFVRALICGLVLFRASLMLYSGTDYATFGSFAPLVDILVAGLALLAAFGFFFCCFRSALYCNECQRQQHEASLAAAENTAESA